MRHALIIGRDCESVEALEDSVWDAGYDSIVRVGSNCEAWALADTLRPSLIVVSPDCLPDGAIGQLFGLSQVAGAPIIVVGTKPDKALQCLKSGVSARTGLPFKTYTPWLRLERAAEFYAGAPNQASFTNAAHWKIAC